MKKCEHITRKKNVCGQSFDGDQRWCGSHERSERLKAQKNAKWGKVCPGCNEKRPYESFWANSRTGSGGVSTGRSYKNCHSCRKAMRFSKKINKKKTFTRNTRNPVTTRMMTPLELKESGLRVK